MTKTNFYSTPPYDQSGYGNHLKGLLNAYMELEPETSLDCPLAQGWEQHVNTKELSAIKNAPFYKREATVTITQPHYAQLKLSDRPRAFYPFCVFEGDKLPLSWTKWYSQKNITKILTPSTYTKNALINSGIPAESVAIIPHGVDRTVFKPIPKEQLSMKINNKKFNFVFVGGWAKGDKDRKDVLTLVKAFCNEFKDNEDVGLILKINNVYNPNVNYLEEFNKLNLPNNKALVNIFAQPMTTEQLAQVYNNGDVFVCVSRSESFGLTFLEAISCGLPCIAVKNGGYLDFLNDKNSWLIDGELKQASDPELIYHDTNWMYIKQESLQKVLRQAYTNSEERQQKSQQSLTDSEGWTWKNSAQKLYNLINQQNKKEEGETE